LPFSSPPNRHTAREQAAARDTEKLRGDAPQLECASLRSIEAARPALLRRLTMVVPRNRCRASLQCYSLVIFFNSLILPKSHRTNFLHSPRRIGYVDIVCGSDLGIRLVFANLRSEKSVLRTSIRH
jgi:hypothetical protein